MLLSVCFIVKDGAFFIAKAINSVKDVADEIIVVDLGSEDKTMELARKAGAVVVNFPSGGGGLQAREYALEQAKGKWLLFLEADEELEHDYQQLRPLLKRSAAKGFYLPVVLKAEDYYMPRLSLRLFRKEYGYNYIEKSFTEGENGKIKILQLPIIKYEPTKLKKELAAQDLLNLDYSLFSRLELEEKIKVASGEKRNYYYQNLICLLLQQQNYRRAEKILAQGFQEFPEEVKYFLWRGFLDYKLKRYLEAESWLQKAIQSRAGVQLKNKARFLLALIYKQMGKSKLALQQLLKIGPAMLRQPKLISNILELLAIHPPVKVYNFLVKHNFPAEDLGLVLVQNYYRENDFIKAWQLLDYLVARQGAREAYFYWQGKVLLHLGDGQKARSYFQEISPAFPAYRDVLDLMWIENLLRCRRRESKSTVNQIKLLGDSLSWNIVKLFNQVYFQEKSIWIEFDNPLTKLKFYRRSLDYLDLLIEFTGREEREIMLEIVMGLESKNLFRKVANLYYKHQEYYEARSCFQKSLEQGESLEELIYLADSCYQLGKIEEARSYHHKIKRIDPYLLLFLNNY